MSGYIWFALGIVLWIVLDNPAGIVFFIIGLFKILENDEYEDEN